MADAFLMGRPEQDDAQAAPAGGNPLPCSNHTDEPAKIEMVASQNNQEEKDRDQEAQAKMETLQTCTSSQGKEWKGQGVMRQVGGKLSIRG